MANEIVDKLYVIAETSKNEDFDNSIRMADFIAKKEFEEFSYTRENEIKYCDFKTVREYISFAKEIKLLDENLSLKENGRYRSQVGFKNTLGDLLLQYSAENNFPVDVLSDSSLDLIAERKLPTTEKLYEKVSPSCSEKYFRWALSAIQIVRPLTINVCRKWIWIPSDTFEF